MTPISRLILLSCLLFNGACKPGDPTSSVAGNFVSVPGRSPITPGLIDEASGLADSRTMDGHVWVNEDSGTPAQLNLLTHGGKLAGRFALPGIANRDWEDMAVGPGPQSGVTYLYLADIGDNLARNEQNVIYRLAEPTSLSQAVGAIDRLAFRYADGPRDAETLLLDPQTRDLWIVTKENSSTRLYQLPYPQTTSTVMTASFKGEVPLQVVTSGSLSPDGQQILLKTYLGVYYWSRSPTQTIATALRDGQPRTLTYLLEPQGEGICFDKAGNGFFTLSERGSAASVTLNYYRRL